MLRSLLRVMVSGLLIASLASCKKERPAEIVVNEPDFAHALRIEQKYDLPSQTVQVTLHVAPGYHAYAKGETTGRPVMLVVKETNGWRQIGDAQIPAGHEKDLGSLGKSQVLEGDIHLSAKAVGGTGPLDGEVSVQICTEKACDRPRVYPFILNVESQAKP